MDTLRSLDLFPKTKDEFRVRTMQGGLSSLLAIFLAALLVRSELRHSFKIETRDRLFVNSSHGASLNVRFEIEFPRAPCDLLAVDANDKAGLPLEGVKQVVVKTRLDRNGRRIKDAGRDAVHQLGGTATDEAHLEAGGAARGKEGEAACGDCYGAQDDAMPCCATCDDVRAQYRKRGWTFQQHVVSQCAGDILARPPGDEGDGCVIRGTLELPAVEGNFHIAPGRHLSAGAFNGLDVVQLTFDRFNVSHVVKSLAFGPTPAVASNRASTKGVDLSSQLDGAERILRDGYGAHSYYLKVVPTVYTALAGPKARKKRELWQYSVTEHVRSVAPGTGRGLPGVFFFYEVSPLCAEFVERRKGWGALLTGLAAIIGGVHASAGLLDRLLAGLHGRFAGGASLASKVGGGN